MHHQQVNLPVDPHNVNRESFFQGLPFTPPFIPPVQVDPRIQTLLPLITGGVLFELQTHAGRNVLRTFYYNLMAQNQFNNQGFLDLIRSTAEYTLYCILAHRLNPELAVEKACSEMCSMLSSLQLRQYPTLQQWCTQGIVDGANVFIERMTQMVQEMQRVTQPNDIQNHPWNTVGPQNPNGGFMPTQNSNWANNRQSVNTDLWGVPLAPRQAPMGGVARHPGSMAMGQAQSHQPARQASSLYAYESTSQTPSNTTTFGYRGRRKRVESEPPPPGFVDEVIFSPESIDPIIQRAPMNPTVTSQELNAPLPTQESLTENKRKYDYVKINQANGEIVEIVPAHLSQWTLINHHQENHPYRVAYNPETHLQFHAKRHLTDGRTVIEEVILPWTTEMEYLRNEIKPEFRSRVPKDPNAPKIIPEFDLIRSVQKATTDHQVMVSTTKSIEALSTDVTDAVPTPLSEVQILQSFSAMKVYGAIEGNLHDAEVNEVSECIEYYADVVDEVATDKAMIVEIMKLATSKDLLELIERLNSKAASWQQSVWTHVHDRLTDMVNHVLEFNMQMDEWSITSITEDYSDLLAALDKDNGPSIPAAIRAHETEIIKTALYVLSGERFTRYAELYQDGRDVSDKVLVLADRISVTEVPWNASDLSLEFKKGCGAISEALLPNLYKAVKSIFARCDTSDVLFKHHVILTNDGVDLEIHRGWLGKDFFLISKA